ncbi:hypothetical protein CEP54_012109 [Fusarium duplospermum]|uniref:Heterokaryon incompatibility domain-containing protein n=1 Tax=Fusarium duplospermum TaxID=1325734 RepID=A0A428PAM3_9HYPO|nr:hypothetical protein CEP54_012109 [Fusarium duplospermum]
MTDVNGPEICTHRAPGKHAFKAAADNCTFFKFCISTIKAHVQNKDLLATQSITEDIADTATLAVKVRHRRSEKSDTLYFMAGWEIDGVDDGLGMHDEFFSLSPSTNSLCIIQDDQKDKVQELAKMPEIYQGALITISASCASACTEGFLHNRSPYLPGVAFPLKHHDGFCIAQVISIDGFQVEPIDTRAWTFQEQVLSERVLEYGTQEHKFLCRRSRKEERFRLCPDSTSPLEYLLTDQWVDQMSQYSSRSLTFQRDKLNAIADVASRFAEASGLPSTEYIVGLWRPFLISGLLWCTAGHEAQKQNEIWVAPSWSWASAQGQVRWDRSVRESDAIAWVLSTDVKTTNNSLPFGSVESGRIILKGRLTQVTRHFPGYSRLTFTHGPSAEHEVVLRTDLSKKSTMAPELVLWLLELTSRLEVQESRHSGGWERKRIVLILKPTGNRDEFRRVGMYEECFPLSEGDEYTLFSTCERCNTISEAVEAVVELV